MPHRRRDSGIQDIRPARLTLRRAACGLGDVFLVRPLGRARAHIGLHLLHGALVGVVATLLYVALTLARPEPFAYLVAHGLKLLGGLGGGFLAGRRRAPAAGTE